MKERSIKITLYKVYCICCSDTIYIYLFIPYIDILIVLIFYDTSSAISPSLNMKVKRNVTEEKKVEATKVN